MRRGIEGVDWVWGVETINIRARMCAAKNQRGLALFFEAAKAALCSARGWYADIFRDACRRKRRRRLGRHCGW